MGLATSEDSHILDNAVWAALKGPQAAFAEVFGKAEEEAVDLGLACAVTSKS